MERQEKVKALSDRDQVSREKDQIVQRYEQLKQEHIGLRQNIERMYTQAQAQQQQVRAIKSLILYTTSKLLQVGRLRE